MRLAACPVLLFALQKKMDAEECGIQLGATTAGALCEA